MSNLKKFLTFTLIIMVSVFYSQEKNKSKIDNYLINNFSLKSKQYSIKSSMKQIRITMFTMFNKNLTILKFTMQFQQWR